MALARCSGCPTEGSLRLVIAHQRGCVGFAELCARDLAAAMVDPLEVYRRAHASDEAPVGRKPKKSKCAGTAVEPVSVDPGLVAVEYWAWSPTLLETLSKKA